MSAPELQRNSNLSWALIVMMVVGTFTLTREYMLLHSISERVEYVNDRATRLDKKQQEHIEEIEDFLKGLESDK